MEDKTTKELIDQLFERIRRLEEKIERWMINK